MAQLCPWIGRSGYPPDEVATLWICPVIEAFAGSVPCPTAGLLTPQRTSKVAISHVMATCFSRFSVSGAGFEPALGLMHMEQAPPLRNGISVSLDSPERVRGDSINPPPRPVRTPRADGRRPEWRFHSRWSGNKGCAATRPVRTRACSLSGVVGGPAINPPRSPSPHAPCGLSPVPSGASIHVGPGRRAVRRHAPVRTGACSLSGCRGRQPSTRPLAQSARPVRHGRRPEWRFHPRWSGIDKGSCDRTRTRSHVGVLAERVVVGGPAINPPRSPSPHAPCGRSPCRVALPSTLVRERRAVRRHDPFARGRAH